MTTQGPIVQYDIWLQPPLETHGKLAALISGLSSRFGTPRFEPHVTVLGVVKSTEDAAMEHLQQMASQLRPFEIELDGFGGEDHYFRCLYYKVRPSPEVTHAFEMACEVFRVSSPEPYRPHLSLVYGHLTSEAKAEVIAELAPQAPIRFPVDTVHLVHDGPRPEEWFTVGSLPLGGQS